jgi:hypothetical protein
MKLSKEDTELFYKMHNSLIIYTNQKLNILKNVNSIESLKKAGIDQIKNLVSTLYENSHLIDSFGETNPCKFSDEELNIVKSWKNFVKGRFLIMRHLKNYTIFLDENEPPKVYGVLGLVNSFEEVIGNYLPVMADTILLPFKDKITYTGIFTPYRITFGGGMARGFKDSYEKAKSLYGIITSLPFISDEKEEADEDKLKFYLKNQRNREMYLEEIEKLMNKNEKLLVLFHQEMGKNHVKTYGKMLRETGFSDGWFAILNGLIIGSGSEKKEVENILKKLLPEEKLKLVYFFQLKKKGG